MKLLLLAGSCLAALVTALPAPYDNRNATIWSEEAVTSMKQSIDFIYQISLDLYHKRTIFDGAPPCTYPPAPSNFSHTAPTACSEVDKFLAAANNATVYRHQDLARAMFPVYYHLPDNSKTPRATFSDFSHYYNHLLIETVAFFNISQWYACKATIGDGTQTSRSFGQWDVKTSGYPTINEGPPLKSSDPRNPRTANNGTLTEYGSQNQPSAFINSFYPRYETFVDTYLTVNNLIGNEKNYQFPQLCASLLKEGLKRPVPPGA